MQALIGSEKQVSWASQIRAELMPIIDEGFNRAVKYYIDDFITDPVERAEHMEIAKNVADYYRNETRAKAWIDMRDWNERMIERHIILSFPR